MFIYLNKKVRVPSPSAWKFVGLVSFIAIPSGTKLHVVAWNKDQGWIACGGDAGLVKVLKLEAAAPAGAGPAAAAAGAGAAVSGPTGTRDVMAAAARGLAAPSNLTMNQTLEGHQAPVMCCVWNDASEKLTTSDKSGHIIVWMLYKGVWYEEMINNRGKSIVRAMKWTADGQKICIVYEDGMVIVGGVDGNRLWGKELRTQLCEVEWSPDGRTLVFGTLDGEVHIYDHSGSFVVKLAVQCLDEAMMHGAVKLAGIEWHAGADTFGDDETPYLAVAYENGRMQLMRNPYDTKPVLVDTGMATRCVRWSPAGGVLAVSGTERGAAENCVQFYTPFGQHLRSLRVPGTALTSMSWEATGLRLALSVDAFVYFAAVRPDYKWGYFGSTVVYAVRKPDRAEHCVVFWDTKTEAKIVKYVKRLLWVRAAGDHCVLVTRADDLNQYLVILCNAIGTPVDSKYLDIEPLYITMTRYHIVIASDTTVYVWQYALPVSKLVAPGDASAAVAMKRREGRERMFHVDDLPSDDSMLALRKSDRTTNDAVCSVCASDTMLVVGRESGTIQRYNLPHVTLEHKQVLRYRPFHMALNCTSQRLAVIDINGVLSFFDLDARPEGGAPGQLGVHVPFERKDVWDMKWSEDNAEQFVLMEKTRMYIVRGTDLEEPITSSGYLCRFRNLKIKAVLLDELIQAPDNPTRDLVLKFETKSLRDSRNILQTVGIKDALQFIEDNPHPRLWRILGEYALDKLDFNVADRAFVRCQDYHAIQLVKRLRQLDDKVKQQAEVAIYFKRFEEADALYTQIDRRDLALDMRIKMGDWFRVLQMCNTGVGDDALRKRALIEIGDYYADRQKWAEAAQNYEAAKDVPHKLAPCYYMLEDFEGMERAAAALPERSPLLVEMGERFAVLGMYSQAVKAYQRAGDIKGAIDCCVQLNQWDLAVELAAQHNFPAIEGLLSQYGQHLLEKGRVWSAVELLRKANHHLDAAKLMVQQAKDVGQSRSMPLVCKKLWVLIAMEIELHRRRAMQAQMQRGFQGVESLLSDAAEASASGGLRIGVSIPERVLENPWHGAEAYHFLLLAQKQLYDGQIDAALVTAMRLREYDDVLRPFDAAAVLALCAYYAEAFGQCSRAFIVLESLEDSTPQRRQQIEAAALSIFIRHPPKDPARRKVSCTTCDAPVDEWDPACGACGTVFPPCVLTGAPIRNARFYTCSTCKRRISDDAAPAKLTVCPLCHGKV